MRCHHDMCSGLKYAGYDYVCYSTTNMVTNEIAMSRDYSLQLTPVNRRTVLPSELAKTVTNTIEQFNVYVHRKESHFTYIYKNPSKCH